MEPDICIHQGLGRRETLRQLQNEIVDVLRRALNVRVCEGICLVDDRTQRCIMPIANDRFYVWLWAFARKQQQEERKAPESMWGFTTVFGDENSSRLYEPLGKGLVIIEPTSGQAVAEIIGNNLYILFNIADEHLQAEARKGVFRRIMRKTAALLNPAIFPCLADILEGDFILPKPAALEEARQQMKSRRMMVARNVSRAKQRGAQLASLRLETSEPNEILDRIAAIPEVKEVLVQGTKLIICTNIMFARHPFNGQLHEFGEFKIVFTFGDRPKAKFLNVTRRPGQYGHPHVDRGPENNWCAGQGVEILKLLQGYEFEAAVLFALKSIESINTDPNGNYLEVLGLFSVVSSTVMEKHQKHPKKEAIKPEAREAFARLSRGPIIERLEEDVSELRKATMFCLQPLLLGAFAGLLGRLTKAGAEPLVDQPPQAVSILLASQLSQVRELPRIKSAVIEDRQFVVRTTELVCRERITGRAYQAGSFILRFDFQEATTLILSDRPVRVFGEVYQAPHLSGQSEFHDGELMATLAELFGGLDLVSMVSLCLDFLTNFSGADIPGEVLEAFEKIDTSK